MSLKDALDAVRQASVARHDPRLRQMFDAAVERLRMVQIAEHAIGVGDMIPDFDLPDAEGRRYRSGEILADGPLVLVFVRGGWCPYCDMALKALDEASSEIAAAGATLVVVTPERQEVMARTAAEKAPHLTLVSDSNETYAALCGLTFTMPEDIVAFYTSQGRDLPSRHAGAGWELPVPAAYVVARDGTVVAAHVDPDWTVRAEPADLIAAVRALP
ncbi:MAG: peroxiredoxin-like family protein [Geminicoccaceae bacterium]